MPENSHQLIDLDQMEASIVRRRLRRWSPADQEVAIALVHALQRMQCLSNCRVVEPYYETNVYPLYYYWRHGRQVSHREVYDHVFQSLGTERLSTTADELRPHVGHTVDTEVDILLEDVDYFVFIEAKEAMTGRKVKFEKKRGVHQLVSQYVQGKILEKMISKSFVLATIGANKGEPVEIKLNSAERMLLQLVGNNSDVFSVVDLTWPSCAAAVQAGKQS